MGLYTSFLLKQEASTTGLGATLDSTVDDTDKFKTLDFGISASFNVFIPVKEKLSIRIGIDNNLGLLNTSDVPVADSGSIKHNSIGLSFGLNVKLN